jgi:hypothetical protein
LKAVDGLLYLAHLALVDVDEVDCGEGCECYFECEYGWVLFYRHEVPVLENVCENQALQEYGAA